MEKLIFEIPQKREPLTCTHVNFRTDTTHISMLNEMIINTGLSPRTILEKSIEYAYNNYEVKQKGK